MKLPRNKFILFILPSLLLHSALIVVFFVRTQQAREITTWAGGDKQAPQYISYIDLTHSPSFANTQRSNLSQKTKSENPFAHQKTSLEKEKKTQTASSISAENPTGTDGPGLDKNGIVSQTAPSTLALIRKKIFQKKKYPLIAKENHVTGTVKVSFQINTSGTLDFINIISSSGHAVLDTAALKTIEQAMPLPYFPQPISLALEYQLIE